MSLSTYTKQELQKKLKSQKIMFVIKTIVIVLMIVFSIFSTLKKGVSFQTFIPLFFIPMTVLMFLDLKKLKKELAKRT